MEEIEGNNAAADAITDTAENSLASKEDTKALPFWVWIVVVAGVVAVAIVVIVRKRR